MDAINECWALIFINSVSWTEKLCILLMNEDVKYTSMLTPTFKIQFVSCKLKFETCDRYLYAFELIERSQTRHVLQAPAHPPPYQSQVKILSLSIPWCQIFPSRYFSQQLAIVATLMAILSLYFCSRYYVFMPTVHRWFGRILLLLLFGFK